MVRGQRGKAAGDFTQTEWADSERQSMSGYAKFVCIALFIGGAITVMKQWDDDKTIGDRILSFCAGAFVTTLAIGALLMVANCIGGTGGGGDFDGAHRM